MISRHYLLKKNSQRPAGLRLFVDQELIPATIDLAGNIETAIERVAVRVRHQPLLVLGAAFGLGVAASLLPLRRR